MMGSSLSAEKDSQAAGLQAIIDNESLTTTDGIINAIMELEPDADVLAEMVAQLKLKADIMDRLAKAQAVTMEKIIENSGSFDP